MQQVRWQQTSSSLSSRIPAVDIVTAPGYYTDSKGSDRVQMQEVQPWPSIWVNDIDSRDTAS